MYYLLECCVLFPEEWKGCCKGRKGTNDLLYIDQHILKEAKRRKKNVTIAWIDNKKAYDMVLQTWMIKCLKMYKISNKVLNFIMKVIKNCKVELTVGEQTLAEVKLWIGIFKGNSLLPLLLQWCHIIIYGGRAQETTSLQNHKQR